MNEQKELAKILGLSPAASWSEIYVEIGRLKEMANRPQTINYPMNPMPLNNPNLHYHGAKPCYQNPCVTC